MKLTQIHNPKLDECVRMWLKQAREQNLLVKHIPDFMASDGWLEYFKKRRVIMFKMMQGEAEAVD